MHQVLRTGQGAVKMKLKTFPVFMSYFEFTMFFRSTVAAILWNDVSLCESCFLLATVHKIPRSSQLWSPTQTVMSEFVLILPVGKWFDRSPDERRRYVPRGTEVHRDPQGQIRTTAESSFHSPLLHLNDFPTKMTESNTFNTFSWRLTLMWSVSVSFANTGVSCWWSLIRRKFISVQVEICGLDWGHIPWPWDYFRLLLICSIKDKVLLKRI